MSEDIIFGVCADVHHHEYKDEKWRMEKFVAEANERKVDFIIQLGDFVMPDKSGEEMLAVWNKFQGDKYHVLGNHDTEQGVKVIKANKKVKITVEKAWILGVGNGNPKGKHFDKGDKIPLFNGLAQVIVHGKGEIKFSYPKTTSVHL